MVKRNTALLGILLLVIGAGSFVNAKNKLINIVTDKSYLADNTGVKNVQGKIQNAINQLIADDGGTIYLPAGAYKITSAIKIPASSKKITIMGDGFNATMIKFTPYESRQAAIQMEAVHDDWAKGNVIKNLTIKMTNKNSKYDIAAIDLGAISETKVLNVHIEGGKGASDENYFDEGIKIYGWINQVDGCNINKCIIGIDVKGPANGLVITKTTIATWQAFSKVGIRLNGGLTTVISNCHIADMLQYGIDVKQCQGLTISGNEIEGCGKGDDYSDGNMIKIQNYATPHNGTFHDPERVKAIQIMGNYFNLNSGIGSTNFNGVNNDQSSYPTALFTPYSVDRKIGECTFIGNYYTTDNGSFTEGVHQGVLPDMINSVSNKLEVKGTASIDGDLLLKGNLKINTGNGYEKMVVKTISTGSGYQKVLVIE